MSKVTKHNITIENLVYFERGEKVMLDSDLAKIYGVETKMLNRAVKRNVNRFPADLMFQLTEQEWESLRYQFGTLNNVLTSQNKFDIEEQAILFFRTLCDANTIAKMQLLQRAKYNLR
jgi:hypothetical protein